MSHDSETSHEDFSGLEHQLHAQRPTPTTDELDRAKRRAMTAATAAGSADAPRRRLLSPARLAMVSLVSGALLIGGSSASLAVSGLSGSGSAGIAQYVQSTTPSTTPNTETGAVAPSQDQGGCNTAGARSSQNNCPDTDTTPSLDPGETGDVAPAADTRGAEDPAQETAQIARGGSDERLPFTGLMALPLLLVGVIMLSAGFLLRRRASVPGVR